MKLKVGSLRRPKLLYKQLGKMFKEIKEKA